ncbi:hypothetical protein HCN51_14245 [Nonomuraea sp. FMUSA5-5]|uniref:Cholesterol esterase n=1 Tax=Nonomuraea composti TaxID=2720023 RepID=A0ABX1AYA8_9ACTN|nr:hypothetical protein [Nonomuraea sp. FMUSA5-5]NJP90600.1 hypothetical protein [Nonomuraea sp. FMUSA5-5]
MRRFLTTLKTARVLWPTAIALTGAAAGLGLLAYSSGMKLATITNGTLECRLTPEAAQVLNDRQITFDAVAPARKVSADTIRYGRPEGSVDIALQGKVAVTGGFSLRGGQGRAVELTDPGGTTPSGTPKGAITIRTPSGPQESRDVEMFSYTIPPANISGQPTGPASFRVKATDIPVSLAPAAITKISDVLGPVLSSGRPFFTCQGEVQAGAG